MDVTILTSLNETNVHCYLSRNTLETGDIYYWSGFQRALKICTNLLSTIQKPDLLCIQIVSELADDRSLDHLSREKHSKLTFL